MIAQIAKVDQKGQYIIFSLKSRHIIRKSSRVNLYLIASKHFYDRIF